MKLHRLKRTVAILACVFVLGGIAAIGAGAEDAAYAPNRSLTISNVSASTAALRMSVLPPQHRRFGRAQWPLPCMGQNEHREPRSHQHRHGR